MKLLVVHITKLGDRSKPVINLGKEPGTKAYRLYDPVHKSVDVSRDVVFEEKKGWNWGDDENSIQEIQHETFTVVSMATGGVSTTGEGEEPQTPMSGNSETGGDDADSHYSSNTETESTTSSEPKHFRSLTEVYDDTEEIELDESELFLIRVEEPTYYRTTAKDCSWQQAMKNKIDSVEKNHTW